MITPIVPSAPKKISFKSGPIEARMAGLISTISPLGMTALIPKSRSSIPPYREENCPVDRVETHPPAVELSIDCGEWFRVRPLSIK